jgi:hypothetical protein
MGTTKIKRPAFNLKKSRTQSMGRTVDANDIDRSVEMLMTVANSGIRKSKSHDATLNLADATVARYQALLEQVISERERLAFQFVPVIAQVLGETKPHMVYDFGARGYTLAHRYTFPNIETQLNFAVMMLLDKEQGYGDALARCKFSGCRKFYFAKGNRKGGKPNAVYCKPAHRKLAHDRKENRTARNSK